MYGVGRGWNGLVIVIGGMWCGSWEMFVNEGELESGWVYDFGVGKEKRFDK